LAKCFYADADDCYAVNQRVCRLEAESIDGKFLCLLLNRHPKLLAYDDGMNQTHLKKDAVLQCPLLVPPVLEEQQRIASCLSFLDDLIAAQSDKLDALKIHKKGLMQQLFL
jgi:type I restriction enzyme S subunit